jgi:hypothetical protein
MDMSAFALLAKLKTKRSPRMADFCKQCSTDMFDRDFKDLAGLTTKVDEEEGLYAIVLCESCGVIQVDREGICVSPDCKEHHG